MKRKIYLLLTLASIVLLAACGKDGATGPQGPQGVTGPTGTQGALGPTGPAGANGTVIYSGNGAPAAATGAIGDFYLDLTAGVLYGSKTSSGWGAGFSLKGATGPAGAPGATGATGATGAAGSQILSGTTMPDANAGNIGDYYLDKTDYLLFGPKTSTGWGTAISLSKGSDVIYSGYNYATNFRDTTIDGSQLKVADLAATDLTQQAIDQDAFEIYFTFGAGIFGLPYTSYAGGAENTLSYLPRVGHFIITRFTADNSGSVPLSVLLQYRYVIIPGTILTSVNHHINIKNYAEVKRYFRIPD